MVAECTKLWSLHLLLGTKIKYVIGFKLYFKRRIVQNGSRLIHIWNCYLVFINMSRPCPNVILVAKDKSSMFLEFCIFLEKPRFIKETVRSLYNIFINIFWLKWVSACTIGCWNDCQFLWATVHEILFNKKRRGNTNSALMRFVWFRSKLYKAS